MDWLSFWARSYTMRIALCIIVEGDSKLPNIKRLIKSAIPAVDTVHITANHKPCSKLKKWCEKEGYDFSFRKWTKDFSDQRNYNFSRAPENTDYILWADSDDVLVGAQHIRKVAEIAQKNNNDVVFFTYWYGCLFNGTPSLETLQEVEIQQARERLIKPGTTIWKSRIHETPVPMEGKELKYTQVKYSEDNPIAWLHLKMSRDITPEELQKTTDRNRTMLELQLEDEKEVGMVDPRTQLYLMKIYAEMDEKLEECIGMGREYLQKSGWDAERAICCSLMAKCLSKLGDHNSAKKLLEQAINEYPYDPLLYMSLARACYEVGNLRAMEAHMKHALTLKMDDEQTAMNNIYETKLVSAEVSLLYYMTVKKNTEKAYRAARLLNSLNPSKNNQQNEEYLYKQMKLDKACAHVHKLIKYYEDTDPEIIPDLLQSLPEDMKILPFVNHYQHKYGKPKVWASDEICYFATFGGKHFENWDGNSLKKGIGGSETAVIRLSEEWAKNGYKVTVYGDPKKEKTINGVKYVPYYKFNPKDKFNILIQWRHNSLIGKVSAKKLLIDLHDVYFGGDYEKGGIDKIMVKSKYHRNLGKNIPDEKFKIISNGI